MFDGIDSIDWSQLEHAYGSASNVPELLRGAMSKNKSERDQAIFDLFGTIYHQGTVYSASSYAVPFLFEMLESDTTPDKDSIAHLLAAIANGSSYLDAHSNLGSFMDEALRAIVVERGESWSEAISKEMEWVELTRQAVDEKFHLLYPFYANAHWDTHEEMTMAFARYPSRARETIPLLKKGLQTEENPEVRKLIKLTIKELQRQISKS